MTLAEAIDQGYARPDWPAPEGTWPVNVSMWVVHPESHRWAIYNTPDDRKAWPGLRDVGCYLIAYDDTGLTKSPWEDSE